MSRRAVVIGSGRNGLAGAIAPRWAPGRPDAFADAVGNVTLLPHLLAAAGRLGDRPAGEAPAELGRRLALRPRLV